MEPLKRFAQVKGILTTDLTEVLRLHDTSPTDGIKRIYVKTIFTYMEGDLYSFKQMVLAFEYLFAQVPWPNARTILFTEPERAMLAEVAYDITGGGEARQISARLSFEDSFKFVVKVFHKAVRLDSKVDFKSPGWLALLNARKIRNRLTHPKSPDDLALTDDDVRTARMAGEWYEATIHEMIDRLIKESFYAPQFPESLRTQGGT